MEIRVPRSTLLSRGRDHLDSTRTRVLGLISDETNEELPQSGREKIDGEGVRNLLFYAWCLCVHEHRRRVFFDDLLSDFEQSLDTLRP